MARLRGTAEPIADSPRQPTEAEQVELAEKLTEMPAKEDELIRHLTEDRRMSGFDFGLQFLDADRMTYWGKRQNANFWIETRVSSGMKRSTFPHGRTANSPFEFAASSGCRRSCVVESFSSWCNVDAFVRAATDP
jgi:hypothetical protein